MFEKLGKNPEFQKVYKQGRSKANKYLVMYVKTGESGPSRYGFSVSKKVGNSVVRSRSKRLISESYRLNREDVKKGYDFVFVARTSINEKKYSDVEAAMINLFKKAGIYIKWKKCF